MKNLHHLGHLMEIEGACESAIDHGVITNESTIKKIDELLEDIYVAMVKASGKKKPNKKTNIKPGKSKVKKINY